MKKISLVISAIAFAWTSYAGLAHAIIPPGNYHGKTGPVINANNNLTSQTDANNQEIRIFYDTLNRKTKKIYLGKHPDTTVTYTYDTAINGVGQPATVTSAAQPEPMLPMMPWAGCWRRAAPSATAPTPTPHNTPTTSPTTPTAI